MSHATHATAAMVDAIISRSGVPGGDHCGPAPEDERERDESTERCRPHKQRERRCEHFVPTEVTDHLPVEHGALSDAAPYELDSGLVRGLAEIAMHVEAVGPHEPRHL